MTLRGRLSGPTSPPSIVPLLTIRSCLRRIDRSYFANSKALSTLGIDETTPPPPGGQFDRDPATGRLNGRLLGTAREFL